MPLTNTGCNIIASALVGAGYTPYNNANAFIGVGDGTTTFDPSQTGLQGFNQYLKAVDASYPTISSNLIVFQATFGTAVANFAWNEWAVFNGSGGGATMLDRVVVSIGTKNSSESWSIVASLTIFNP